MTYERLKKVVVSAALAAAFVLSVGFADSSVTQAQYGNRDRWGDRRWDQRREREGLSRIRRLDRDRQLRYRTNNSIRTVGYYDRFGRFHAYGFYDGLGRFHRN
ncbi:MAG: hypothetical protein AABO41_02600 [Acidobacteriota bacterium]